MDYSHVLVDITNISILAERTRALLANRPVHLGYKEIAEKTGLTYGWVQSFAKGHGQDYGVNKVQKLYEFLANKPLFSSTN
jgi:hypothetical protein